MVFQRSERLRDGLWLGVPIRFGRALLPVLVGLPAAFVLIAITKALVFAGYVSFAASTAILLVFPAVIAVIAAWTFRRQRVLWTELDGADDLLCLRCGYRLDESIRERACPECGCAFDPAPTREAWRDIRAKTVRPRTAWSILAIALVIQLLGLLIILPLLL